MASLMGAGPTGLDLRDDEQGGEYVQSRRASQHFVQQEMDNLKKFKRLSIGQASSVQDPDLPIAQEYSPSPRKNYKAEDNMLWVPASVHPEVSPNEWMSFVAQRTKRDSVGSRLSQVIDSEGDFEDASAVLEKKRRSQGSSNKRHSILELSAFEQNTFSMEKPIVPESSGASLKRSGASSRRQRPDLRRPHTPSPTQTSFDREQTASPAPHSAAGPEIPAREPSRELSREPSRTPSGAPAPTAPSQGAGTGAAAHVPQAYTPPNFTTKAQSAPDQQLQRSVSQTKELPPAPKLRTQASLPELPTKKKKPVTLVIDTNLAEQEQQQEQEQQKGEPKSFWRWRRDKDKSSEVAQAATSPTAKAFSSLFKRKKDKPEPGPADQPEESQASYGEPANLTPSTPAATSLAPVDPLADLSLDVSSTPSPAAVPERSFLQIVPHKARAQGPQQGLQVGLQGTPSGSAQPVTPVTPQVTPQGPYPQEPASPGSPQSPTSPTSPETQLANRYRPKPKSPVQSQAQAQMHNRVRRSSHHRAPAQAYSRHEAAEVQSRAERGRRRRPQRERAGERAGERSGSSGSERATPERSERANTPERSERDTTPPNAEPKKENDAIQLPYAIPAHQVSDRSVVMMYHRFPLHIERAIYRFSHMKLANPRRPLREQVLLSNFMYAYLNLINQGYQQQMEQQALTEFGEDDETVVASGLANGIASDTHTGNGESDFDFEFYQQNNSSSSSSSSSEIEDWGKV